MFTARVKRSVTPILKKIDVLTALNIKAQCNLLQQVTMMSFNQQYSIKNFYFDINQLNNRTLYLIKRIVKSIFNEMFGYGNYNYYTLEKVCTFIDYRGKTPEKSDFGYRLITAKNVKNNHFTSEPQEFISPETYEKFMQRGYPKIGDVLFTTEAPLGNVCKIPNIAELKPKFGVGQRIITLQPHKESLDSTFLEYVLLSKKFQSKLFQKKSGSTVIGIRSKLLKQLTIPVPHKSKQLKYANIVNQRDKLKLIAQQISKKISIIQKTVFNDFFDGDTFQIK